MIKRTPVEITGGDCTSVFIYESRIQTVDTPYGDTVVSNIIRSSLDLAATNDDYYRLRDRYTQLEISQIPSYAVRKWSKAHVAVFASSALRSDLDFPASFEDQDYTSEVMTDLFSDERSPYFRQLESNLRRPLQVSRPERKFLIAFIGGLLQLRNNNDEPIVMHDYGGANGMILHSLAVGDINDSKSVLYDKTLAPSGELTERYRKLAETAQFAGGYWIEIDPPKTPEDEERIKYSSVEPHDLRRTPDDAFMPEDYYDQQTANHSPNVELVNANFARMRAKNRRKLRRHPADIAVFSHSLSENAESMEDSLDSAIDRTNPNGLIVVTDRVDTTDESNQRLIQRRTSWYHTPWTCLTYVLDLANRDQGWVLLAMSENGIGTSLRILNEEKIVGEKIINQAA